MPWKRVASMLDEQALDEMDVSCLREGFGWAMVGVLLVALMWLGGVWAGL